MCNRLWAFMPVLAYALQKRQKLYVLFAKKGYLDYFPHLKQSKIVRFLFSHDRPIPASLEWRLGLYSERHHLEVTDDLRKLKHTGLFSFVDGWQHRCDVSFVAEQKKNIIKIFQPADSVIKKVKGNFSHYDGITVGVHIRRGDYKDYLNGRYYYSNEVYLHAMEKLHNLFAAESRNVRFLICSNEQFVPPSSNQDIFSIDGADAITDLYALSCCDYIIGPPSSFSQWASFYGEVPICFLLDINQEFFKDSFSRIVTMDTFENGKRVLMDENTHQYYIG